MCWNLSLAKYVSWGLLPKFIDMECYEIPFMLVSFEDASNVMPLVMPLVMAEVAGVETRLVLDTGASHTCMDKKMVKPFIVPKAETEQEVMGIGGRRLSNCICLIPQIRIGGLCLQSYKVVAVRMGNINRMLSKFGQEPIGGLLGSDFFGHYHAVIDYASGMLRLQDNL